MRLIIFLVLIGLQSGQFLLAYAQVQSSTQVEIPRNQNQIQLSFAPLVEQAAPAVVNVYSLKTRSGRISPFANDPFFQHFFDRQLRNAPNERIQSSLGSGVIVSADGVIVTNHHVVKGADELRVVLHDRREFIAELVLEDERTDLAVLKLNLDGDILPPALTYADTRDVKVGDLVLAIGNPFGVGQTVTNGIVSATARTDVGISDYAFFIQTDAAINPGNSGGALIDTEGRLIGVNTAIFSRSGGSNGIGFAIPSEMVKRVVYSAVNEGYLVRPWLGLKGEAVTAKLAKKLGMAHPRGVRVTQIYPESPAVLAGIKINDLITSIDGYEVFDEKGLRFLIATLSPDTEVELEVIRNGMILKIPVRLTRPPGMREPERMRIDGHNPFAGIEVVALSPAIAEEMGQDPFRKGLLINRVARSSFGARMGFRPGDILIAVNGNAIDNITDLEAFLTSKERRWRIVFERNGRRMSSEVRL